MQFRIFCVGYAQSMHVLCRSPQRKRLRYSSSTQRLLSGGHHEPLKQKVSHVLDLVDLQSSIRPALTLYLLIHCLYSRESAAALHCKAFCVLLHCEHLSFTQVFWDIESTLDPIGAYLLQMQRSRSPALPSPTLTAQRCPKLQLHPLTNPRQANLALPHL